MPCSGSTRSRAAQPLSSSAAPAASTRSASSTPSCCGCAALPAMQSRSTREPSGSATNPSSVSRSASRLANAAIGDWQLPPSRRANARSASMAARVGASSSACSSRRVLESPTRHSMPMTPWPTAGSEILGSSRSVMRDSSPRRAGRRRQARWRRARRPSRRLSRVSTLPRSGFDAQVRPRGQELRLAPQARGAEPRSPAAGPRTRCARSVISASRGSARGSTAAMREPRRQLARARPSSSERPDRRYDRSAPIRAP